VYARARTAVAEAWYIFINNAIYDRVETAFRFPAIIHGPARITFATIWSTLRIRGKTGGQTKNAVPRLNPWRISADVQETAVGRIIVGTPSKRIGKRRNRKIKIGKGTSGFYDDVMYTQVYRSTVRLPSAKSKLFLEYRIELRRVFRTFTAVSYFESIFIERFN